MKTRIAGHRRRRQRHGEGEPQPQRAGLPSRLLLLPEKIHALARALRRIRTCS